MMTAINSALQGLQDNQRSFVQHADRISRWGGQQAGGPKPESRISMAEEMVGVIQAQRGFEANLPVIRAADEMLGTLLDTFA